VKESHEHMRIPRQAVRLDNSRVPHVDLVPCQLCGQEVLAVPRSAIAVRDAFPDYDVDIPNARIFEQAGDVFPHHECSSRQASRDDTPYWDASRAWWACKEPTRPIDGDAHFDLNCPECAVRWSVSVAAS
jgi:hypothetical protein